MEKLAQDGRGVKRAPQRAAGFYSCLGARIGVLCAIGGTLLKAFGFLLRLYSYLFHLALSLFLLAIVTIAATSHQPLNLRMLPFSDDQMLMGVLGLGLAGLGSTLLAITRAFKYLFPLWAGYALYALIAGFFFSSYSFANRDAFATALWLILAAVGAFVGAVWTLRPRRGRLYS